MGVRKPLTADTSRPEPSDEVYRVYGSVMHTVQYWELALALRWWQIRTPRSGQLEAESKAAAKAVARLETAFKKITASQARKELEDDLPPELLEAVGDLIEVRNRLAHGFLREQQFGAAFKEGTLTWLGNAGARFDASFRALGEEFAAIGPYDGGVRPHWPLLGETLADRLFAGEPVGFEAALREAREKAS